MTSGGLPPGRALLSIGPIFPLKPGIGFTNIVQERQHGQPGMINLVQATACRLLQRPRHGRQAREMTHDGSDVRHVIDQAVNCDVMIGPRELATRNESLCF